MRHLLVAHCDFPGPKATEEGDGETEFETVLAIGRNKFLPEPGAKCAHTLYFCNLNVGVYRQLPLLLYAFAHHDLEKAQECAKERGYQYNLAKVECHHPMGHKFLGEEAQFGIEMDRFLVGIPWKRCLSFLARVVC